MTKLSLYLESSVIGCLTMWPSRDIVVEAHRQITLKWWRERRNEYEIFVSQAVIDEISKGDPLAAEERLAVVKGIPLLDFDNEIIATAKHLLQTHALPDKAVQDALHIAITAHYGADILLTWNCTHIANPHILKLVRSFLLDLHLSMPEVTTPETLLGDYNA